MGWIPLPEEPEHTSEVGRSDVLIAGEMVETGQARYRVLPPGMDARHPGEVELGDTLRFVWPDSVRGRIFALNPVDRVDAAGFVNWQRLLKHIRRMCSTASNGTQLVNAFFARLWR